MNRDYRPPAPTATDRRRELRARILHALGDLRGPVRPEQRGLSCALAAADDGQGALAARLLLREGGA